MKIDSDNFGYRIEKCMKNKGITNKELTIQLDLSKNALGNYKNNQIPNATILYKISQKLGVSMEWLLTGSDENDLNESEKELLQYFRRLPPVKQAGAIAEMKFTAEQYKSPGKSSTSEVG